MKQKWKLIVLVLFGLGLVNAVFAVSQVIATPGFTNVGELEPGESQEIIIYINVDSEDVVPLEADFSTDTGGAFSDRYLLDESEYSEQPIEDWVELQDIYYVDPSNPVDEDFVTADEELSITIDVPEDAEPGYRTGRIFFTPEESDRSDDGFGASTLTSSIPEFMFRVSGDAERSVEFSDVNAVRTGEEEVQLIQQFENTGTVTTRVRGGEVTIVDDEGRRVGEVELPSVTLAPGEFGEVDAVWNGAEEGGEYEMDGVADYITGQAYVGGGNSRFVVEGSIRDSIDVEDVDEDLEEVEDQDSTPMWLVIMMLTLLGVLMYSMNIDPFWIVISLALITITATILLTSLPNWILALVLVGSAAAFYLT